MDFRVWLGTSKIRFMVNARKERQERGRRLNSVGWKRITDIIDALRKKTHRIRKIVVLLEQRETALCWRQGANWKVLHICQKKEFKENPCFTTLCSNLCHLDK